MEISHHKIDLTQTAGNPTDLLRREHAGDLWLVPFSPLDFQQPPDWRTFRKERHISIPLFPYNVATDHVDAFGFAMQLGVRALYDLGDRRIRRFHLSLGQPANLIEDPVRGNAWQFYVGLGVILE